MKNSCSMPFQSLTKYIKRNPKSKRHWCLELKTWKRKRIQNKVTVSFLLTIKVLKARVNQLKNRFNKKRKNKKSKQQKIINWLLLHSLHLIKYLVLLFLGLLEVNPNIQAHYLKKLSIWSSRHHQKRRTIIKKVLIFNLLQDCSRNLCHQTIWSLL